MCDSNSSADSNTNIANVSGAGAAEAALGKDALATYKQMYADQAAQRAATTTTGNAVAAQQVANATAAENNTIDLTNYANSTFRPVTTKIATDALNYDTPERRAQAAAAAGTDVQAQIDNAQGQLTRNNARMGATVSSGRQQQLAASMAIQGAIGKAGAADTAVRNDGTTGTQMLTNAAGIGSQIDAQKVAQQQVANSALTGAVGSSTAATAATQSGNPLIANGYGTSINAVQGAGNLYGQAAVAVNSADNIDNNASSSTVGGIASLGQAAGNIYGAYNTWQKNNPGSSFTNLFTSSKKKKGGMVAIHDEDALDAVTGLKNEAWKYNDAGDDQTAAPAASAPGAGPQAPGGPSETHIGPYAEDVQKAMGNAAAPGGKMINVAKMGEQNRGAIRALSKQLEDLEAQLAKMEG